MSHTPGPWLQSGNRIRKDEKGKTGHGIVALFADGPQSEWQGNLRLIAAAPELLEALRFYANPENYHWDSRENKHRIEEDEGRLAREAIRKATGSV